MSMSADLGIVEDRCFVISKFRLHDGAVIPEAKIAYETYGQLAPDRSNAVLITHGYTSTHHAAGRKPANANLAGWWDGLIGPGKAMDTHKLFVLSSNKLGSSSGSTNGASVDPRTGRPYGPDCRTDRLFPPSIAPTVMDALAAGGVDARYFEIDSNLRHSASGPEHAKWSPVLREFLAPLVAKLE
jgi:homoserine acetyltransferase